MMVVEALGRGEGWYVGLTDSDDTAAAFDKFGVGGDDAGGKEDGGDDANEDHRPGDAAVVRALLGVSLFILVMRQLTYSKSENQ